ncbi:hypothetical protein WICPIJ_009078 [Wickerhamomyces pijperi]|uniref:Uncharacterized protein n=1 Tax=Wickerhamomyces pijperi TaxID=599730 RepID=A0A9P8PQE1_WICPI|nr:hypothetical protein WICPIJ_009078 [Wickerhamomyces pijperi]
MAASVVEVVDMDCNELAVVRVLGQLKMGIVSLEQQYVVEHWKQEWLFGFWENWRCRHAGSRADSSFGTLFALTERTATLLTKSSRDVSVARAVAYGIVGCIVGMAVDVEATDVVELVAATVAVVSVGV